MAKKKSLLLPRVDAITAKLPRELLDGGILRLQMEVTGFGPDDDLVKLNLGKVALEAIDRRKKELNKSLEKMVAELGKLAKSGDSDKKTSSSSSPKTLVDDANGELEEFVEDVAKDVRKAVQQELEKKLKRKTKLFTDTRLQFKELKLSGKAFADEAGREKVQKQSKSLAGSLSDLGKQLQQQQAKAHKELLQSLEEAWKNARADSAKGDPAATGREALRKYATILDDLATLAADKTANGSKARKEMDKLAKDRQDVQQVLQDLEKEGARLMKTLGQQKQQTDALTRTLDPPRAGWKPGELEAALGGLAKKVAAFRELDTKSLARIAKKVEALAK